MTFNLLEGIKYHTHENEKRSTSEELCKLRSHVNQTCEDRHDGNEREDERTREGNS